MSAKRLLGLRRDGCGNVRPVFAAPDLVTDALSHHRAVVEAYREGAFLPARFSQADTPLANLAGRIAARREALATAIDDSATCVEISVRVWVDAIQTEENAPALSGRGYLQASRARSVVASSRAEQLRLFLEAVALLDGVQAIAKLADADGTHILGVKVRRTLGGKVAAAITALGRDGLCVEVKGPWPLYSFGADAILNATEVAGEAA